MDLNLEKKDIEVNERTHISWLHQKIFVVLKKLALS